MLGGAITAVSLKKINRALEISRLNRLPYIQFVESAGGDLRRGTEDPDAEMRRQLTHFAESGRLFHDITCLSGERHSDGLGGLRQLHRGRRIPARDERLQHLHPQALAGVSWAARRW